MTKRILSALLLIVILSSFGAFAEETAIPEDTSNIARVVIDVSEPDEDDIITAKFTVYNTTYKGIMADFSYNKEAITPVDYETKEPTTDFARFAKRTTVAKNLGTGEDIANWCTNLGSFIDNENGTINYINSIVLHDIAIPNSFITENNQILVNQNGVIIDEFYFKKITDTASNIELVKNSTNPDGLTIVNGGGELPYICKLNISGNLGNSTEFYNVPKLKMKSVEQTFASESEKSKAVVGRAVGVIFLQIDNYAAVSNKALKWVDKENKKLMPYIKDGRTMVPLRFIAEQSGAVVSFDDDTQVITMKNMSTTLTLKLGEKEYYDDGLKRTMDVVPEVIDGRTFVPVRFVSEALGNLVNWLEKEQLVIITPKIYPWDENSEVEKALLLEVQSLISAMFRDFAY